jgi:type III secretion protein U
MKRNDSEERTLPATPKKLRDARKRGQVSRSRDAVAAIATVAAMLYLWLGWSWINERLIQMLTVPAAIEPGPSFLHAAGTAAAAAAYDAIVVVAPLLALVVAVVVVSSGVALRGFVFAADPIKPRVERLNPIDGFKRIFSLRNLVEFIKSLLKAIALFVIVGAVAAISLDALAKAPGCGLGCLAGVVDSMALPILIGVAILLLLNGMFDVGIQNWLFLRDMRMTKTEFKRERKDLEGDPTIRQVRQRRRREFTESATRLGIGRATLVVADGERFVVGLRYVRGETPVPITVCRGRGEAARLMLVEAGRNGTPIHHDAELAQALSRLAPPGSFVPRSLFDVVSVALVRSGAV